MAVNSPGTERPMKVVLWGINYGPEPIGIAPFNQELAQSLAANGHDVTAVTAFAYYPFWRKTAEDEGRWHRTDFIEGVRVERCWCYVPKVASSLRRIAHELSFGLASFWRVLGLPRADVYLVVSPPLVLGFFAWIAAGLKRSRYVFHVQDLQPDAAVSLGMLRRGPLVSLLYGLEKLAYAKASRVSGISAGMVAAFAQKNVPIGKCVLLPNWLRTPVALEGGRSREEARRELGVPPDALLAVYAGNLGRKQGLEIIIAAARCLDSDQPGNSAPVEIIMAGDGAARSDLAARLAGLPSGRVRLLPLLEETAYRELLKAADVALITQSTGVGRVFFPSKLLTVLDAQLPVIAVADDDSELAYAVREGGFGARVDPGDAVALAAVLRDLAANPALHRGWREHTNWVRKFAPRAILDEFEATLRGAVAPRFLPGQTPRVDPVNPPVTI